MAETIRINAAKTDGTLLESPNTYALGEGSVAEMSARDWHRILEGRALDNGMFYDIREAPPDTGLYDHDELRQALAYVYGDSADVNGGHVDLDALIGTIMDSSTDPQTARADFLNQAAHARTRIHPSLSGVRADARTAPGPTVTR
ncbi:hypothetical protein ACQEU5_18595 [Marinactinospora thermotolerans]|uniref:Uncharacterized protein n=1 Tax=Marinactinospora thermotolerans DSM 45154 TaxID=1122192 RepID=A0A1T4T5P0_9ACTN|nr:hypothetical protein SAMN02745673_04538 [Marinactinospora thermotolerans DSM 45154]